MIVNYADEYDHYWSARNRFGEQSSSDANALAEEILLTCGGGKLLDIGSGMGCLVRELLRLGVDAYGVDVSQVAVTHANTYAPGRFHAASVLNLPFESNTFETVILTECLELLSESDVVIALKEIRRVVRRSVYLKITTTPDRDDHLHLTIQPRVWWEQRFFEAGFRKHPSYYRVNDYEALDHDGRQVTILLECIPDRALASYPLQALADERDLHMDMLRETGARSDAHVARYQWATTFIRPGDTVLDAACGLGYGSYVLQSSSTAARTFGIDGSEYAIKYAQQNFAAVLPELEFRWGLLPEALADIADHSVDVVVSFETLEHVEANTALMAEFHRILTPGGRIITSVPNDWSDETGRDPNPFHVHVYTLDRLRKELTRHFMLEMIVAQTASQHKVGPERKAWQKAGRSMKPVLLAAVEAGKVPDAEWWLAVAMRSPLEGMSIPYRETTYPTFANPSWNVTTFARDYKNPWLVRSMVDIGHRIRDPNALRSLAEEVLIAAEPDSPDAGAALCVLAYQLLFSKSTSAADVESINRRIDAYLCGGPNTPHGIRWSISLLFVSGQLWMAIGDFERAASAMERCIAIDPLAFSPLLCNRTVEAHLILGLLNLARNDPTAALKHWRLGVTEALRAMETDWHACLGDIENPAEFGLPELASVLEHGSSCAYALVHFKEILSKPWWWLHPRRDRLSQTRLVMRNLEMTRQGLLHSMEELTRYRIQADEFARQITGLQNELVSAQTHIAHQTRKLAEYQAQELANTRVSSKQLLHLALSRLTQIFRGERQ